MNKADKPCNFDLFGPLKQIVGTGFVRAKFFVRNLSAFHWVFVIAIIILISARIITYALIGSMGPFGDEDNYIARGQHFWGMVGDVFSLKPITQEKFSAFYYNGYWPPLYSVIIMPIYDLFGYDGVRFFGLFIDVLSGLLIFRIANELTSRPVAIISLLIYSVFPPFFIAASDMLTESLHTFFFLISVYIWTNLIKSTENIQEEKIQYFGWTALGLSMAAALLTRASFLPLFIAFLLSTLYIYRASLRRLIGMGVATLVMLSLTVPWNLAIVHQEERFMFLQTISAVQLTAKYSAEGMDEGWNVVWRELGEEAKERGVHRSDVAAERVRSFLAEATPGKIGVIAIESLVSQYLFGENGLETKLRLGLYPDRNGALFGILVWNQLLHLPFILIGFLGLLLPLGRLRHRGHFVLMTAATVGTAVLGAVSGKHLIATLVLLVIPAAVFLTWLWRRPVLSVAWTWFVLFAMLPMSLLVWSAFPVESHWTARYRAALEMLGREATIVDTVRLRRFSGCHDRVLLGPVPGVAEFIARLPGSGEEARRIAPGEFIPDVPLLELEARNLSGEVDPYLLIFVAREPQVIDLSLGRAPDWRAIDGTCLAYNE